MLNEKPSVAYSPILNACRELMLHRSNLQLATAFDRLADSLLENATKAYEPKLVGILLDARSLLQSTRPDISETFIKELILRLDGRKDCHIPTSAAKAAPSLSLVADEVLDEYVAAQMLGRAIESSALSELPSLHQRIASLRRTPTLKLESNPFSPQSIVSSLLDAMLTVGATPEIRLHWLRGLATIGGGLGFPDVYADLNRHLTDAGIVVERPQAPIGVRQPSPQGHAGMTGSAVPQRGAAVENYGATGMPQHVPMMDDGMGHLQQMTNNLAMLVERLQYAVPSLSALPMESAQTPTLANVARSQQALQVSAALGFAPDGSFRQPAASAVDAKLLASLTNLQMSNAAAFGQQSPQEKMRNLLREVVPGYSSGEMSMLDATTTELVAMLFDFVLARNELRDEIKVLLGRLQIPMLKAAMLDRGFFSSKNHPGRQLLNRLADAGIGWSQDDGTETGLYKEIRDVVDRINRDFVDDLSVFTAALVDVEQFIVEHEREIQSVIEAETVAAQATDRIVSAEKMVKEVVAERIEQHALPEPVRDFIEQTWQPYLHELLLDDKSKIRYAEALEALDELIWSVTPKYEPIERAQLSQRVPALVNRLRQELKTRSGDHGASFFDKLFEVHAGLLRGAQPDYLEPPIPEASNEQEFDPFMQLIKQMERNQWIELSDDKGALTYAKLAWVSPQGTTYLFTTRSGRKAASMTPEELVNMFRSDRARLLESEPIVDRALAGMFQAA